MCDYIVEHLSLKVFLFFEEVCFLKLCPIFVGPVQDFCARYEKYLTCIHQGLKSYFIWNVGPELLIIDGLLSKETTLSDLGQGWRNFKNVPC